MEAAIQVADAGDRYAALWDGCLTAMPNGSRRNNSARERSN